MSSKKHLYRSAITGEIVTKQYAEANPDTTVKETISGSNGLKKTLGNTTSSSAIKNVKDIVFWGDGDTFKLISKASSKNEGWMKSTKAMQIDTLGCVVQVTTQQGENVAEALVYVPGVKIMDTLDDGGNCISRELVAIGT